MRALIVDDEAPAREELRYLLRDIPTVEVVGEAAHAQEALELIRSLRYDVVFLDIRMSGPDGLELARTLQGLHPRPQVVFVTAYGEYALSAFEVQAADYLLKPVDAERLQRAVDRVANGLRAPNPPEPAPPARPAQGAGAPAPDALIRIPVPTAYKTLLVDPADVYYLKAFEGGVRLVTEEGEMTIRSTLKDLEARLDPSRFFRAHRNFIINLEKVAELIPDARGGLAMRLVGPRSEQIPLSRRQARRLRRLLDL
ncbi:MAG: LytTR family DNA-binding domain-containing protein [Thermaerobacter sp.]